MLESSVISYLCCIHKQSNTSRQNIERDSVIFNNTLGTLGGASLGGLIGHTSTDDYSPDQWRNTLIGTGLGGLAGLVGSHLANRHYANYKKNRNATR